MATASVKKVAEQWETTPESLSTYYLFYQGMSDSQSSMVRYLGGKRMKATTGEVFEATVPTIDTILPAKGYAGPELDEINRKPIFGFLNRIKQWFRGIKKVTLKPTDEPLEAPEYSFVEDGSVHSYAIKTGSESIGQKTDIANHKKRFDALSRDCKPTNVVLYAASRGAATTFSALAEHKEHYTNVKLCVLEAPPATISSVVKAYISGKLGSFLYKIFAPILFRKHKPDKELQAMGHVSQFPDNVPLFVTSSRNDRVVPHKSSLNLALRIAASRIEKIKELEAQGNDSAHIGPVYFVQLDKAKHNVAIAGAQSERYQNVLHAVYKKHQLPYVARYAQKGEKELQQTAELTRGALQEVVVFQSQYKNMKNLLTRKELRKDALSATIERVKKTEVSDASEQANVARQLKVCASMPLFAKYPPLLRKTQAQYALDKLTKEVQRPNLSR